MLVPGGKETSPQDLQFREYAGYVRRALDLQGFLHVDDVKDSEAVILLDYAVSEPHEQTHTYAIPQWGQTGYRSATTYGSMQTYGRQGIYTGTTYFQPSYGVTGYTTGVYTTVTYARTMSLVAFDAQSLRQDTEVKELWRVSANSVGSSGDLRIVFPYLIAAARPYLGRTTEGRSIDVKLRKNDARVLAAREGSQAIQGPQ